MISKKFTTTNTLLEEMRLKDPALYQEIIEDSNREIERIKSTWGGKRSNSGRKKQYNVKVKETFNLEKTDIINLREYAKKCKISKNKALHEAISALMQQQKEEKSVK